MKKIAIAVLLIAAVSSAYGGPRQARQQQRQQKLQPARPNAAIRPNAQRRLVEEALLGFYVKQLQQDGEISPEVRGRMLPFLEQFVQDRFEISQRRTRALNQLRQGINRNASEDDLRQLVRELDAADAEFQANQERFLSSVDPLLNARQQAKLRVLQSLADNRIRQMLEAVQNPPAAQRPNPPPVQPQN